MSDVRSLISHYAVLGLSRHIQTVCDEVIKKRGREASLVFWRAYGAAAEGGHTEAIRDLESVRSKRETELAVVCALIHYHKQSRIVDHEAVSALEKELPSVQERAPAQGLLLAGTFFWHIGDLDAARGIVQKMLIADDANRDAKALHGWIDLSSGGSGRGKDHFEKSIRWFESALDGAEPSRRLLGALMGRAKYYEITGDFDKALDSLNEVTVIYAWFLPALAEKARIVIKTGDWDQGVELARKVLDQDAYDIESLRIIVFELLCRQAQPSLATSSLGSLIDSLTRHEPKNPALLYRIAQPFARLAGRSRQILELTLSLIDQARTLDPTNSLYFTEFGYQQSLLGEYAGASESYRQASKLDESNVSALAGMIYCQIAEGAYEDAEQQLELFRMIQASIGRTAELAFLDALLAWRKNKNSKAHAKALDETCTLHWNMLREFRASGPAGADLFEYFNKFNPEFLVDVAKEYLVGLSSGEKGEPTPMIAKGIELLVRVTREVPGMLSAQLLLAKTKNLTGDVNGAMRVLNTCLRLEPTFSDAHLLMAEIAMSQDNFAMANSSLDQALSHDFQVRDSPVYHLVKAKLLQHSADLEEAVSVLEAAMRLPGVKTAAKGATASVKLADRASIFIQLAEVLTELNRIDEATKIVSDALHQFTGTTEEVRVIVANARIAVKRGKVDSAIRMLGNVPFDSPAFATAQTVKADIYLKHRHDRRLFIQCYLDIVDKSPSEKSHVMLGEAYMAIQMPVEATAAFEAALKLSPDNTALASKVGRALIATHNYHGAVDYYEDALAKQRRAGSESTEMRSDLTQLYVKLRRFDEAARLLDESLRKAATSEDVSSMIETRGDLLLLARVHKGTGDMNKSVETLTRALELQNMIITRLRSIDPALIDEQREEAANVCVTVAQAHLEMLPPDQEKAKLYFQEAVKAHPAHIPALLGLAKLHLERGELDECQSTCQELLRHDEGQVDASVMLADIMFRKDEAQAAQYHFQQLLERDPSHYSALHKLIMLLKRAGQLKSAPRFIRLAERASARAEHEPGLKFCKGVFNRFSNDHHTAIKLLNQVRMTGEWGLMATEHMVEIYLSPDSPDLWAEDSSADSAFGSSSSDSKDNSEACSVADKLLRDIPRAQRTPRHAVLEAYVLIVSKNRANVDQAIQLLGGILSENPNDVRALVALATALMVLKQTPKARNQLKRVAKMPFNSELADQFVQAYLLLADIYIGTGKYDLAQDFLKKALAHDKSCSKAWEYMGLIMEKEAAYKDASDHYEQAWTFDNEASAGIGFKLAFNYLKAERYVEAIAVCHKVLALYPDYPKIRKEILERARSSLRP